MMMMMDDGRGGGWVIMNRISENCKMNYMGAMGATSNRGGGGGGG
jgi:hypothetical protein